MFHLTNGCLKLQRQYGEPNDTSSFEKLRSIPRTPMLSHIELLKLERKLSVSFGYYSPLS
jgi:hypothetical protein